MADKNLQFLDVPRTDPAKAPVEVRLRDFREIYAPLDAGAARPAGGALPRLRQSRSANGSARSTTTFPTG